ncbi:MAG: hypothetical protein K9G62_06500 [Alphaproteobacteria bacterium]|nr:hypothetical protein [Alphaproteobacteria bacterium]
MTSAAKRTKKASSAAPKRTGRGRLRKGFLLAAVCPLAAGGCAVDTQDYALAPPPPGMENSPAKADMSAFDVASYLSGIETAAGPDVPDDPRSLALSAATCKNRDEPLSPLSYRWGQAGRNSFGLIGGMRLGYRLSLPTGTSQKPACS